MNTITVCEELKKYGLLLSDPVDIEFAEVSYDSRSVGSGTLFVCKGLAFKEEYLAAAAAAGACAYVSEKEYPGAGIPGIIVSDVRKALSIISILFCGRPFESFKTVGLTGTKGKTTTSYLIKGILDRAAGKKTAILSTVEMYTGGESEEAHLTTPESLELQGKLAEVRDNNIPYLTMEVSSQGYKVSRVFGMTFDVGVFLNIDEDHIGPLEHPDFADYLACKTELVKNSKNVIIYKNTREFESVYAAAKESGARVFTYGEKDADFIVSDIEKCGEGFKFRFTGGGIDDDFTIDMEGRFNVLNAAAAITVACVLGIDVRDIKDGLRGIVVPGRMNVYHKGGSTVIVDYAHNFLSFTALFESLIWDYPGRPIKVVGGCPGGKNYKRRVDIGHLCGKYASYVYLTEEDPGFEDAAEIAREMASYIDEMGNNTPYEIETDRVRAVEKAMRELSDGDILIIAGKGEEDYRKFRGQYLPCESDISVVQRCLKE